MADPPPTTYDELPYINRAFPQTHPDRIGTIARLFGLHPPDPRTCRVLELGCASGDNLIPMALGLPDARFVGIDLSLRQVEEARQTVEALALANIELSRHDIADVDASWGAFDYIICHGVYSWVPAPTREKILAICRENLAPNGVAYVSYNTLPGWHIRGMIRDMMIYHAAPYQGAAAKVRQARALLDFLAQSVPATQAYGMMLRQEQDAIRNEPDAYLFHDHLEVVNDAVYFHQFAEAAGRHGLEYLGEAEFGQMTVSNSSPQVTEALRRIGPGHHPDRAVHGLPEQSNLSPDPADSRGRDAAAQSRRRRARRSCRGVRGAARVDATLARRRRDRGVQDAQRRDAQHR